MKAAPQEKKPPSEKVTANRRLRRFLIGSSVVLAVLAGGTAVLLLPRMDTFYTDADTINEPAATARILSQGRRRSPLQVGGARRDRSVAPALENL